MNATHYPPSRFLGTFDELLSQTLRGFSPESPSRLSGAYRSEDQDSYRLRLDLPGFTREEISLSLERQDLTVAATSERDDAFLENYERTFSLPEDIDLEGIAAKFDRGVLDITFRKLTEEDKGIRTIELS